MATVTPLLTTPGLAVGEFHCPPGDASWRETNVIGDRAHVVFPRRPVVIRHLGREPVLATPNHAMLYNAEQAYHRRLHSERGDDSVFVALPPESLERLAAEGTPVLGRGTRIRTTHVPTDRRTYLLQHLLVRHLRGRPADLLRAEEAAARLTLSALAGPLPERHAARARTAIAHRRLAEAAKCELATDLGARLTLGELAARLHTSAFHLARVFRAQTGFSLAGYRQALRLRTALERLPLSERDLTSLALELGFASHSHFTARFTREYGVPPSGVRDGRRARALLDAA
ncbi:MAG TPA: helix-turn-helix transcriptional regulator [Gaiellaceae bacterium]|nr:helix-turn-helix transcriptional regulator [Gaiellaceae bacterium]